MKFEDIDYEKLEAGEYCQKGNPGCFCKVGWPPELQCPDCRWEKSRDSYCICPPPKWLDEELDRMIKNK